MRKREYKDSLEFKEDFLDRFIFGYCVPKGRYSLDDEFNEKFSNAITFLMGHLSAYLELDDNLIEELFNAYSEKSVDQKYANKYCRVFNIFNGDLIMDLINLYDYLRYSNNIVNLLSSYRPKGEVTLSELLKEYKINKKELVKYIFLDSHLESELRDSEEILDEIRNKK